jgi:arabinofuranosyltransferase
MKRPSRAALLGIVGATCFVALAYTQRWLHDDGFINLRIVRNIVAGYGPVFNPSERVEAGTSPLWLALLALQHALGAPLERGAVVLGIACTALAVGLLPMPAALATKGLRSRLGLSVPLGFFVFTAVRPSWEYASSGLETGLACLWLVASSVALVLSLRTRRQGFGARCATAFLLGLGPLVRPDYVVYSALFLIVLLRHTRRAGAGNGALAAQLGSALALPVAVQVARMGYFGTFAPNTALAKEAFRANFAQGRCYLANFFGTYRLGIPLGAAGWLAARHVRAVGRENPHAATALAIPAAAAVLHATYLVLIGGDYMHARLLLPDLLAFLVPAGLVSLPLRFRREDPIPALAVGIVLVWAPVAAISFRVKTENQCGIGDEHGWYVKEAARKHPVLVGDYEKHAFYKERAPAAFELSAHKLVGADRERPLRDLGDPREDRALSTGAIGIVGFSLPSSVHVIDRHGLAEPVAARFRLGARGRPGHEKELTTPWIVARFAAPEPSDSSDVLAARRALSCGPLAELVASVSGPLTFGRFVDNLGKAVSRHRLRYAADPFEAASEICDGQKLTYDPHGGTGGDRISWMCPDDRRPTGLRARMAEEKTSFVSLALACGTDRVGRTFGENKPFDVELECPEGTYLSGYFGHADTLVHELGLTCTDGTTSVKAARFGSVVGEPFESSCAAGQTLGLAGRVGQRVDAIGAACVATRSGLSPSR